MRSVYVNIINIISRAGEGGDCSQTGELMWEKQEITESTT